LALKHQHAWRCAFFLSIGASLRQMGLGVFMGHGHGISNQFVCHRFSGFYLINLKDLTVNKTWMCLICGWIYDEAAGAPEDGIAAGTRLGPMSP
jgi:hypothetical protein